MKSASTRRPCEQAHDRNYQQHVLGLHVKVVGPVDCPLCQYVAAARVTVKKLPWKMRASKDQTVAKSADICGVELK